MLIRFLLSIFLGSLFLNTDAQVKIRLFYGHKCEAVIVRVPGNDHYLHEGREEDKTRLEAGEMIYITRAGERVAVKRMNRKAFITDSLVITCLSDRGYLDIAIPSSAFDRHEYEGDFIFSSSLGQLKIVNTLAMDDYIAGVVQAEGGYKGHPEYFKSQAVIARTYAYLHLGKHASEGYDLCDDVHCQAYHGRSITERINMAVNETAGQVITDGDSVLILTPFHSNCGGETVSSENVWLKSLPYLKVVYDPYCAFSRNALWEQDIERSRWLKYLEEKSKKEIKSTIDLSFEQKSRLSMYRAGEIEVPLKVIRTDWGFRSTFFSIRDMGENLHFSGRGYGHGVGLCQEGAMVMASRGFSYIQILNFYYKNVKLIKIDDAHVEEDIDLSF